MVFVVERYLPGLSRSDLLRGLLELSRTETPLAAGPRVRYLGSTIVPGDEACYCQFDGPTAAAVAEANRRVGLPYDRIVPAVAVRPEALAGLRRPSRAACTPGHVAHDTNNSHDGTGGQTLAHGGRET